MTIARLDQPVSGQTLSAIAGQTNLFYIGIGNDSDTGTTDAPTFRDVDGNGTIGTLVIHGVNFSEANTLPSGGSATVNRTNSVLTYTPLNNLTAGTTIIYDVHGKDIVGWIGEYADPTVLPNGAALNSIARVNGGNYYQYDGTNWNDLGSNPSIAGVIEDHYSSITFTIAAGGGGGGGGGGLVAGSVTLEWAINTSVGTASQYEIAGTGTTDIYTGGTAPVQLSTVDDPALTGSEYSYSSAASTEANINNHGTLQRLGNTTVQYNPTGQEAEGDSYVYNVVVVDANGTVAYGSVRVNILAAGGGGGGGGGTKTINYTSLATESSTTNRKLGAHTLDMTPHLTNAGGTGTLTVTDLVNCVATDFVVDQTANTIEFTKTSGVDGSYRPVVV